MADRPSRSPEAPEESGSASDDSRSAGTSAGQTVPGGGSASAGTTFAKKGPDSNSGVLYVVATPIGNLEDLTPRAARTLLQCAVIAAEDTRVTGKLLGHAAALVGLLSAGASAGAARTEATASPESLKSTGPSESSPHRPRLTSYREQTEQRLVPGLLKELEAGRDVALACDAGTPGVSDPGYRLVREAAARGFRVVPVPGVSASLALLSVAGLPTDRFAFVGFPPSKPGPRQQWLRDLADFDGTAVLYESPRRVTGTMREIAEHLGDPACVIGRELTKLFEETLRGSASDLAERLEQDTPRGEFSVAIDLRTATRKEDTRDLRQEVRTLLEEGRRAKAIWEALRTTGVRRSEVYDLIRELTGED